MVFISSEIQFLTDFGHSCRVQGLMISIGWTGCRLKIIVGFKFCEINLY